MVQSVQFIDSSLFNPLKQKALASPRLRTNYNYHSGDADNPHRFLNVLAQGTFIPPHRHLDPPKSETLLVLEGKVGFFLFDDEGRVTSAEEIGDRGRIGVDIPSGVWHTLVVLTPFAVVFEVKAGPYDPSLGRDFAPWAPREADPGAADYNEQLITYLPRLD
jgi:cupin fold WbuC family metalloprotein